MSTSHLSHPKYRPDIDGLRALAVVSVVAYHSFPNGIQGGFIGVDIFFVISGFLISSIIFENLRRETFSFSEFYVRRIKRIFPGLLATLIACWAAGWFVLLADEYKQLGKHIAGGVGFVSNFVLWGESGYFDNAAENKPLLHLWSLGIEEQFYIFWPLLLWLAARMRVRMGMATLAVLALAGSFYLNLKGVNAHAEATFYAPWTRFWELLSGSLLAMWTLSRQRAGAPPPASETRSSLGSHLLSTAGVALLAYGFTHIDRSRSFPGGWALLPVGGAVCLIAAGPRAWFNRLVLSNPVAVWLGLISFPLYLWHWPLLSFMRIVECGFPAQISRVVADGIAVALAWLTYRLLERPIRFGGHSRLKVTALLAGMVAMGLVGGFTYRAAGLPVRAVVSLNAGAAASGQDGGDGNQSRNECGLATDIKRHFGECAQDKRGPVRYALLGDSKAGVLYPGLVRTSSQAGRWMFIGGNGASGPPIPLITSDPQYASFQGQISTAVEAIARNPDVKKVVLVTGIRSLYHIEEGQSAGDSKSYDYRYLSRLDDPSHHAVILAGMSRVVDKFVQTGKQVVVLVDNPALPEPRDCSGRKSSLEWINSIFGLDRRQQNRDCFVPLSRFNAQIAPYRALLEELRRAYPGQLQIVDATDIFCDVAAQVCGPTYKGRLLYAYTDHMSDYAAGLVGRRLNADLAR